MERRSRWAGGMAIAWRVRKAEVILVLWLWKSGEGAEG